MVTGSLLTATGFFLLAVPGVGGPYWTTFLPGLAALGAGMGVTVTPLTTTAMGAAGSEHAGVASGINNAVARTASLLAIGALGVLLMYRFSGALARELDAIGPGAAARAFLEGQQSRLAAAELPADVDEATRAALRHGLDIAFVTGFRWLMVSCGVLAGSSAIVALVMLRGRDGALQDRISSIGR